jgi:hypothetical protein
MEKAVGRGTLGVLRGAVELIDGAESRKILKNNLECNFLLERT